MELELSHLRRLLSTSEDWLWTLDRDLTLTSVHGRGDQVPPWRVGKSILTYTGAQTDPAWAAHLEDLAARRRFSNFEYVVRLQDTVMHLSSRGEPIFSPDGSFFGYVGATSDQTARKLHEAELRKRVAQQECLATLSRLALNWPSLEQVFIEAAAAIKDALGADLISAFALKDGVPKIIKQVGWASFDVNKSLDESMMEFTLASSGVVISDDVRSDPRFSISQATLSEEIISGIATRVGPPNGAFGLLVALSKMPKAFSKPDADFLQSVAFVAASLLVKKEKEDVIHLRERALAAIGQGILITNAAEPTNPIIYANPTFCEISGYTDSEVTGRNCRFLQGKDTDAVTVAAIRTAVRQNERYHGTIKNYRKDGTPFWNELTITPFTASDGSPYFVGVQSDVTKRIALEGQLRYAQKMDAIGQLTGGVAHDFNNLLTVILGNADALVDELIDKPSLRNQAELIQASAEKGSALVQQLLAYARRQTLSPTEVNLNDAVKQLLPILRSTVTERIEIKIELAKRAPVVIVDLAQLESAILNLVLNSRDSIKSTGAIHIQTANAGNGFGEIRVIDNGCGMTALVRERAFEPFFTTKENGGSGLGLSMVYGFARQSGGDVTIASQIGKGTEVKISLPKAKIHVDVPFAVKKASRLPRGSGRNRAGGRRRQWHQSLCHGATEPTWIQRGRMRDCTRGCSDHA